MLRLPIWKLETMETGDDFQDQEIANDIKAMGFDMLNRANNHNPVPGLLRVDGMLQDQGITWAGVGENLAEARAPRYLDAPKGRIALVGMVSMSQAGEGAYPAGPETPGASVLRLTMYQVVTADELEMLRKIRDDMYSHRLEYEFPVPPIPANEPTDRLRLSQDGQWYKAGDKSGMLSFTMNPGDEREILRSVRNGKENSDFLIATIHSHEDRSPLIDRSTSEYPTDFLVQLAHDAIDNGADAFVGTGVHMLHGVEIYKGKPIFYDMHSFAYGLFRDTNAPPSTSEVTGFEQQATSWASPDLPRLNNESGMQSVVAECKYDKGELQEVILHPIDLGFGAPMDQWGIPHVPSPEVAQKILQRLQRLSKPFGTTIDIEGNLGVIHVQQPTAAQESGATAHSAN